MTYDEKENYLICSCGRTFAGGPSCGQCVDGRSFGPYVREKDPNYHYGKFGVPKTTLTEGER